MRYQCEQGHRILLQRQRPPCCKEILPSLLFLLSLDNGKSGAHSTLFWSHCPITGSVCSCVGLSSQMPKCVCKGLVVS